MTDTSKEALDALVDPVGGYKIILAGHPDIEDQELRLLGTSDTFMLVDAIDDLIEHAVAMADAITALHAENDALRQQIAAAEAAATERAADACRKQAEYRIEQIRLCVDLSPEQRIRWVAGRIESDRLASRIRAQIPPEAASALAAREAAADRAGYLRGLREAAEFLQTHTYSINAGVPMMSPARFPDMDNHHRVAAEAILALADRAEKGGA